MQRKEGREGMIEGERRNKKGLKEEKEGQKGGSKMERKKKRKRNGRQDHFHDKINLSRK